MKIFHSNSILAFLVLFGTSIDVYAAAPDAVQLAKELRDDGKKTDIQQCNSFLHDGNTITKEPLTQVIEGAIAIKLLTPLNSSLAGVGDNVYAVVTDSALHNGKPWLPQGTVLEGRVEGAKKRNFSKVDGSLAIRFYKAEFEGQSVELSSAPDTENFALKPGQKKITKKARIRGVLMTVTRMAVPMAIGTGGMSVAITAGAGAIIGGVFADDHKYLQGVVDGAWRGAGGGVLDPILRKGQELALPEGSPIILRITENVEIPKSFFKVANAQMLGTDSATGTLTSLQTTAKVIPSTSQSSEEVNAELAKADKLMQQGNLAAAFAIVQKLKRKFSADEIVNQKYEQMLSQVTGSSSQL